MAESFFESQECKGRQHCAICREVSDAGLTWRQEIFSRFDTGPTFNFACPYGQKWVRLTVASHPPTTERPTPTARQAASFVQAALTGKYAPEEIVAERMATCRECDFLKVNKQGVEWCGVCGCKVSAARRELKNLAAYEENLPAWGCKHPKRAEGKGWKR